MGLRLDVYHNGRIYQYDDEDDLDDIQVEPQQGENEGVIELEDVEVQFSGTSFLGYTCILDLPAGPWRARIVSVDETTGAERVVVNGRIRREEIRHAPVPDTWSVTVLDDAASRFLEILDGAALVAGTSISVHAIVQFENLDSQNETQTWYDLSDLWASTAAALEGVSVEYQDGISLASLFPLRVRYLDGGSSVAEITRNLPLYIVSPEQAGSGYLPDWPARKLFDVLRQMLAWRVSARYTAFPSPGIEVRILSDKWILPDGLPEVDDLLMGDGYEMGYEPADREDFALAYSSRYNENRLFDVTSQFAEVWPSQDAYYAARRSDLSPDGEPQNQDVVVMEVSLPQSDDTATQANYQPEPVEHPDYEENRTYGVPVMLARGAVYVGHVANIGGNNRLVTAHAPLNPAAGQLSPTGNAYAVVLHNENYQMSRQSRYVTIVNIDVENVVPEPRVGDPLFGVRFLSRPWIVREKSVNGITFSAELRLIAPDPSDTDADVIDAPSPPAAPPINLTAEVVTADLVVGQQYDWNIYIVWDWPSSNAQEPPVYYEVQWKFADNVLWETDIPPVNHPNSDYEHIIPNTIEGVIVDYRVRTVNGAGESIWTYASVLLDPPGA